MQFIDSIDSARSTESSLRSLRNLVKNIGGGNHRIKCKYGHDDKKCETSGIRYKFCNCWIHKF